MIFVEKFWEYWTRKFILIFKAMAHFFTILKYFVNYTVILLTVFYSYSFYSFVEYKHCLLEI